ncbi:MAG TPA: SCO family protein [Pyrinomonadaceae bacterium]|jgi:protein SCO1/2
MKKSSAQLAVLWLKLFAVILIFLTIGNVSAQRIEHYNSPLYSPKTYDPNEAGTSNGLPPMLEKAGIEQKLGAQIPLDAVFKDENGREVKIGEYFGKRPVILALVYYECPMLCNEVLNGLTGSLKSLTFDTGKDFDVVAISFDARENDKPDLAKNKKESYMKRYSRPGTENGWHFLTGTQGEIDKVANSVGFKYAFDEATNQFAHAGGVMVITPEGKVSRYLYGIDYAPKDVKFAVMESAENKVGSSAEQLLLYCYHYDPSTGKYGLSILKVMRLAAVATVLGLGVMLFVFWRRNKAKSGIEVS